MSGQIIYNVQYNRYISVLEHKCKICVYISLYTQSTLLLTQQISFNQNGVAVRITFNMLAFLFLLTYRFLRSNYCLNHGKIYKCRCPRPLLLTGCEGNSWLLDCCQGNIPKVDEVTRLCILGHSIHIFPTDCQLLYSETRYC